jgi:hypothetical protein
MVSIVEKKGVGQAIGRTVRWLAVILFVAAVFSSSRALAEPVIIWFSAVVEGVDDALCQCIPGGTIEAGDSLIGFYTYDSAAPDVNTSSHIGRYEFKTTPYRFVVYHENYTFASDPVDPFLAITVEDSMANPAGRDTYSADSWNNLTDPFQSPLNLHLIAMNLADDSGTALENDSLIAPVLAQWPVSPTLDIFGNGFDYRIWSTVVAIGLDPPSAAMSPRTKMRMTNHPNPFNPATTIRFGVPVSGKVAVEIYDVTGRRVRTLVERVGEAGREHVVQWDGRDASGREMPSGVYFGVLRSESGIVTRKLVLLR